MATLLTIDWDYFVPLRPEWDFSHAETLMYLDVAWMGRAEYVDKIRPTRSAKNFWYQAMRDMEFGEFACDLVYVSESHALAFDLLQTYEEIDRVVIVDAHHDCWPSNGEGIGCDNWLTAWLSLDENREATWVYPEWLPRYVAEPRADIWPGVKDRIKSVRLRDVRKKKFTVDAVHACRSGCWTPPWCDSAWLRFLGDKQVLAIAKPPWDGLQSRWARGQARKLAGVYNEFREDLEKKTRAQ